MNPQSAEEGSVHVLREGLKAGVKKFVTTGSMVTWDLANNGPWGVDGTRLFFIDLSRLD